MTVQAKQSIRGKLTRIIMMTSTTAVLLACLGFVISDFVSWRQRLAGDLSTLAQVVGSNSTVALTFGDGEGASEVLNALRAKPSIVAAGIYTETGEPLARYEPVASISIPGVLLHDGFHERGDRIELFYGIRHGGKRLGTLYLVSDSRDRAAMLKGYATIAASIVLVSLLFAFLLSSRLQRIISDPIVELARVARLVSENKNYSVRANRRGPNDEDEIDHLMTGFNGMLAEIEQRDSRLLVAKSVAEKAAEVNAGMARQSALILNSATDGILGVDLDNRLTFMNPAAVRILGMTLSDIGKKSVHEAIHHSYPDGTPWPEAACVRTDAMRRGESFSVAEETFWRADGTSFPVEFSSTSMFDEHGAQIGAVVMFRDVTERRAVERLKSEFVSTVSHELRTPLTSIRGALGLLSSGMLGTIAEKGQRMLAIAVSNTDRLVRLINDILDLERIESGKIELQRGPVSANAVMVQAMDGVQSMADDARVRLVIVPATGALWGDSDRIIQTLTNLLGNAIKFSPPDTSVTLSGDARGEYFTFCVADQGRGVPENKLETIFERFSQVDASDSRDKGGSGLGLAICQSIINAHGGRIWAEKNEPAGSRFQFTIPLATPMVVAVAPTATTLQDRSRAILVVEDDLDLAGVMAAALQSRGFQTLHAATGNDAIRMCWQQEPSLIVLDLLLPDIDGFAVVNALRDSASLGRTPLLVYSALDVGSADQARLRLGATEFLTKSRSSLADFERHVVRLLNTVAMPANGAQHAA
jgi:PAS domain S-box-containing protein